MSSGDGRPPVRDRGDRTNLSCSDGGTPVSFPPALPVAQRLLLVFVGGGLLALLAVARWCEPDPRGYGTHQRLGFPPCTTMVLFGVRCPSCGMTTAWSHLVRGQLVAACRANVGGVLVGLAALVVGPCALLAGWRGRWQGPTISPLAATMFAVIVVVVTLADWIVRLVLQ